MKRTLRLLLASVAMLLVSGCRHVPPDKPFTNLFSEDGVPKGWIVRNWANVKDPHPGGGIWKVENGILHGSDPRGTWLISEREYDDFILEFEFKLGEQGNSGCGLSFPLHGDPAFDGLELQTDILAIKTGSFVGTCRAIFKQMLAIRCSDSSKCQVRDRPADVGRRI